MAATGEQICAIGKRVHGKHSSQVRFWCICALALLALEGKGAFSVPIDTGSEGHQKRAKGGNRKMTPQVVESSEVPTHARLSDIWSLLLRFAFVGLCVCAFRIYLAVFSA